MPEWDWRQVRYGWSGPVSDAQTVRPILIPAGVERLLSVARVALLVGLAALLPGVRRFRLPVKPAAAGWQPTVVFWLPSTGVVHSISRHE